MSALATTPQTYSRVPLRAGDAGTAQTIEKIRELVNEAWKNPAILGYATNVIRNAGVQAHDSLNQIRAIYNDAKTYYFLNDPWGNEVLHPAEDLINWRAGDCDDINAILLPSVLGAAGFETRVVTVAADGRDPNAFSHIYCEVNNPANGQWIPLDAARPHAAFGLAPQSFYKRWWWALDRNEHGNYPAAGASGSLNAGLGRHYRSTMGRYHRSGMGDASSAAELQSVLQQLPSAVNPILQAVNGQPVVSAYGAPAGPGGFSIPPAPTYFNSIPEEGSIGNGGILLLVFLGLLGAASL